MIIVLVRVSVSMKTHHSYGNTYKSKHLIGWFIVSEVQAIIFMVGPDSIKVDLVMEKELRVWELHLDPTANRK